MNSETYTFITGGRVSNIIKVQLCDANTEHPLLKIRAGDGSSILVSYGTSKDGYASLLERFDAEMAEIRNDSNKVTALMGYMHHVCAMAPKGLTGYDK